MDVPLFQIVHMTFINCNNIEVFLDNPFEMQNLQAQKSGCTKIAFKFRYLSPSIRKFSFLIVFSQIFLLFIPSKHHFFKKARSIFMDCQKKFRITLKDKTFIRFCKFFRLQILAQTRAWRKVVMGLNGDYDVHRCWRL